MNEQWRNAFGRTTLTLQNNNKWLNTTKGRWCHLSTAVVRDVYPYDTVSLRFPVCHLRCSLPTKPHANLRTGSASFWKPER